jgi:hypothetical protein
MPWQRGRSGVNVVFTIFRDFRQFLAKTLAFFFKNKCYDTSLQTKCSILNKKMPIFFAKFFGENIFKIKTLVPIGTWYLLRLLPRLQLWGVGRG